MKVTLTGFPCSLDQISHYFRCHVYISNPVPWQGG